MHPRNKYQALPSFSRLAVAFPALRPFIIDDHFDPKLPHATETLVKALLHVDFGITSYEGVPPGFLIPSVTRSLNYIHFMEDLLSELHAPNSAVRGIDLGTGASCILPILGCALHHNWRFVGLDIDFQAVESARKNSEQFSSRIEVLQSDMFANLPPNDNSFQFLMCNPPFFATSLSSLEDSNRHDMFGGRALERSCQGGEVAFVSRIIDQSFSLFQTYGIDWFTSMVGLKASLSPLLGLLKNMETVRIYRLEQGQTFRWVVAWSFRQHTSARCVMGKPFSIPSIQDENAREKRIDQALDQLHHFSRDSMICGGRGFRFRIRIQRLDNLAVQVDVLDISPAAAETQARTIQRKVEQDLLQSSRKWRRRKNTH